MDLQLGISPCPNDTYIFAALVQGLLSLPAPLRSVNTHYADVEQLNALARQGRMDLIKISAATIADVTEEYAILNCGGALGRGCGPLLIAPEKLSVDSLRDAPLAVPGLMTTANLLLSLHGAFLGPREELPFDAIMPALQAGRYAAGVIIHESRFTYAQNGFELILDLGNWWEKTSGAPLPLGVIAARRSLGMPLLRELESLVRQSLFMADAAPEKLMPFIRSHAQEMDGTVLRSHIAMFVNEFSADLGSVGREAIRSLCFRAAKLRGKELPEDWPLFVEAGDA